MANFYQVNGRCVSFIAFKLKKLGYRNIHNVRVTDTQCFINMKDNSKYELKLVPISDEVGKKLTRCVGFELIKLYPGCPHSIGYFEPYTTGEFFNYPEIWKPIYR